MDYMPLIRQLYYRPCKSVSKQRTLTVCRINTYAKRGGGTLWSAAARRRLLRLSPSPNLISMAPKIPLAQVPRTCTTISPIPSTRACMTSPGTMGPTPSGVPVIKTSPGSRV